MFTTLEQVQAWVEHRGPVIEHTPVPGELAWLDTQIIAAQRALDDAQQEADRAPSNRARHLRNNALAKRQYFIALRHRAAAGAGAQAQAADRLRDVLLEPDVATDRLHDAITGVFGDDPGPRALAALRDAVLTETQYQHLRGLGLGEENDDGN